MRKLKVTLVSLMLLIGNVILTAQEKSIPNYSFHKISPAVSSQSNLKINMLIGRTVFGVSSSNSAILQSYNFLSLKGEGNNELLIPEGKEHPAEYSLQQNFPNPFNPVTSIKYSVPEESYVSLAIYNMLGEKVQQLVDETIPAGIYTIEWDAHEFTSGVYLYTFRSRKYTESKKLLLLK